MEKRLVAIVIPIYKIEPSASEKAALKQLLTILVAHPVYFVCSTDLANDIYLEMCRQYGKPVPDRNFIRFEPHYFSSIMGYNQLLLSKSFYEKFIAYDFILIYQLDCWVFRDELNYWCNQNFDYIGAPWINTDIYRWLFIKELYPFELKIFHRITKGKYLQVIGNGGFSLRKTKSMFDNTELFSFRGKTWRANATLLPGITIGANALIGAGSVVTQDVPDGEIWIGNPAKYLRAND